MTFTITYSTGRIEVIVENYFVKASIPNIRNLFKVAREYSSEKDRKILLGNLVSAKAYWKEWFEKYSTSRLSSSFREWYPFTKVQLRDLLNRLDKVIVLLKREHWK